MPTIRVEKADTENSARIRSATLRQLGFTVEVHKNAAAIRCEIGADGTIVPGTEADIFDIEESPFLIVARA